MTEVVILISRTTDLPDKQRSKQASVVPTGNCQGRRRAAQSRLDWPTGQALS